MAKLAKKAVSTTNFKPPSGASGPLLLDNLGQLRKSGVPDPQKNLEKRARAKCYTQAIVGALTYIDSPMHKMYERTFFCGSVVLQEGNKVTSRYCDSRVCHVCNRIRTAKMMKGYIPQLEQLEDLRFVTLTKPTVKAGELASTVDQMTKVFRRILDRRRKQKIPINGIRKSETTYNSDKDRYHPHYHVFVDGQHNAEYLVNAWLEAWPAAEACAQNIRTVDQGSFNELFKYTTKIVEKAHRGINVYVMALDTIVQAYFRKRSIQPFGCVKKIEEDVSEEDLESQEYDDLPEYEVMTYMWEGHDWFNPYGEGLSGHQPLDITINHIW